MFSVSSLTAVCVGGGGGLAVVSSITCVNKIFSGSTSENKIPFESIACKVLSTRNAQTEEMRENISNPLGIL